MGKNEKEWQEVELDNIISSISETYKKEKNNVVLINTSDVLNGKVLNHSINIGDIRGQFKKSFKKNDILYSEIRPINKRFAFVDFDASNYIASTKLMVLRVNPEYDVKFIYCILTSNYILTKLQTIAELRSGTFPQITFNDLKKIKIKLPPLEEQKKIASILSSLDDKIELNNRMNKILEEMAQTIFKEWFVNFNFPSEDGKPYKDSGGKMIESELGAIPEGWKVMPLDNLLIKFTTGFNPRKNFKLGEGNNYYVTIKNMNNNQIYLDNRCDKINDEAIKKINKRSDLRKNDLLFSGIGTIGRVHLINKDVKNWNISESIFTMRANDIITPEYLYLNLLDNRMQEYALNMASGSVQRGIRMMDLKKYNIIVPEKVILKLSTKIFNSIIEKVNNNFYENQKLDSIRDTLLPKLMSGEIKIK